MTGVDKYAALLVRYVEGVVNVHPAVVGVLIIILFLRLVRDNLALVRVGALQDDKVSCGGKNMGEKSKKDRTRELDRRRS